VFQLKLDAKEMMNALVPKLVSKGAVSIHAPTKIHVLLRPSALSVITGQLVFVPMDLLEMHSEHVTQSKQAASMTLNVLTVRPVWMDNARIPVASHMHPVPPMQFVHQRVTVLSASAQLDGLETLTQSASNVRTNAMLIVLVERTNELPLLR
jgi:hypothetical protein